MKILMVVPSVSKNRGGTVASIMNFYRGVFDYDSIECTIVSTVTKNEIGQISSEILENEDFILFHTKSSGWRYSKKFKNYLQENLKFFDLIWVHTMWTSTTFFAAKFAMDYAIPYVITPHGMIEPGALNRKRLKKKLYWAFIEKSIFDNASMIHCITHNEEKQSKKLSKAETFVIPNGVEVGEFIHRNFKKLHQICFIGRFHSIKGLDLLLKAMKQVDNLKLVIAGGGEKTYEDYIFRLIDELNLGDRVEYVGFADKQKKSEIMARSKFIVVPSYSEVLSLVALEAISESLPVLITKQSHFDEIEYFGAGIIISNNEPETIKNGIEEMLQRNLENMSFNAYKLATENYSIHSLSQKLICRFNKIA